MTVKLMAFLTKRRDISRADFSKWYEEHHVPTILEVMPGIIDYRRNFLAETVAGIDVVTEIVFPDQATFDCAMAVAKMPVSWQRIEQDQQVLFDPEGIKIFIVDERGGPCRQLSL